MSTIVDDLPDNLKIKFCLDELQSYFAHELWLWHPGISYNYAAIKQNKDIVHDYCEIIRKILGYPSYVYKSPDS